MSIKSLLDKLGAYLNEDRQVQAVKHKSLKKILKALKRERDVLEESLADTDDSETRQEIESRLKIVSAQRKKGLAVLRELKNYRKKDRGG